jgi:hypothetical protein
MDSNFPLLTASTFHCVVGIAIRYGMDGMGIVSRWGRYIPHPPRLALEPTQLSVWEPSPLPGDEAERGGINHLNTYNSEVKKGWRYAGNILLGFRDLLRVEIYFASKFQFC